MVISSRTAFGPPVLRFGRLDRKRKPKWIIPLSESGQASPQCSDSQCQASRQQGRVQNKRPRCQAGAEGQLSCGNLSLFSCSTNGQLEIAAYNSQPQHSRTCPC